MRVVAFPCGVVNRSFSSHSSYYIKQHFLKKVHPSLIPLRVRFSFCRSCFSSGIAGHFSAVRRQEKGKAIYWYCMLEQLFGSRVRVKLLKLFLGNPDQRFFVREITRLIDERISAVRREILNLERLGIIQEVDPPDEEAQEYTGAARKYFQTARGSVLFHELKQLVTKAELLGERELFEQLASRGRVKAFYLYGVFVGDYEAPVDVFIVGSISKRAVRSCMADLKKRTGRTVRYTVMSVDEYRFRNEVTDRFLVDLMNRKKVVIFDKLNLDMREP